MKDLMKDYYNPIQHGNVIFKNNNKKASSKDWEKRHKKNDEKIKDIKFGFVGYSEKSKTLEGILELCDRYNLEPMQVVLLDDFEELNTRGNLILTDYIYGEFDKNNPRFKFLKPLADLCDVNSLKAYMHYLNELDYRDSNKNKILDYTKNRFEKGCIDAVRIYFLYHFPSHDYGVENGLKLIKEFKEKVSPEVFQSVITEILKKQDLDTQKKYNKRYLIEEIKKIALP